MGLIHLLLDNLYGFRYHGALAVLPAAHNLYVSQTMREHK
jgi:hypothetical protein